MTWLISTLTGVYFIGLAVTIHFHAVMAPNVIPSLVFFRAFVWPIYLATGWPHGQLLTMD